MLPYQNCSRIENNCPHGLMVNGGISQVWVCSGLWFGQSIQRLEAVQMACLVSSRWATSNCIQLYTWTGCIELVYGRDLLVGFPSWLWPFFTKPWGALTFRRETGFYKIDWSNTTRLESTLSVKNRSMELSELVRYEGRLFAFCLLACPKQLRITIAWWVCI